MEVTQGKGTLFACLRPFWLVRGQARGCWEAVLLTGPSSVLSGGGLSVSAQEVLTGYWGRVLGAVRPAGQVSHPVRGLSSSHPSYADIVSDVSVRISSIAGFGPGD